MSNYELAPAGEIEVEIVAASIGEVAWKVSEDNRKGECLRLRLRPAGNYAFIFQDVPLDWDRMLESVRAAVEASSDIEPAEFIGRRARVVLKRYQAKDGTTRAAVAKWIPAAKRVEAATPGRSATLVDAIKAWEKAPVPERMPQPKPSRNAQPKYGPDDDIPF